MIEKASLSQAQSALIQERLSLPEHLNDLGPSQIWSAYQTGLFAFFTAKSGQLVALVEASGIDSVKPGWWIDSVFRGKGYGKKVIDILALHLRKQGITHINPMAITTYQQQYDQQSKELAKRLRSHFEK